MAAPKYRFFIYFNDDPAGAIPVHPNYKDDIAKEYGLENNQRFFRAKLSGKISFLRGEFDFIMLQPFETQFNVLIERSDDWGQTWVFEFLGKFFKTDGEINEDDRIISVQLDTVDDYSDVLAGLDKEYNLITLAPEVQKLTLHKRPLIQVYIPGDNVVSCFLGGSFWEQDANATTDETELVNKYKFSISNLLKEVNLKVAGLPAATGLYTGKLSIKVEDGNNVMRGNLSSSSAPGYILDVTQVLIYPGWTQINGLRIYLKRVSDGATLYKFEASSQSERYDNLDFTMTSVNGSPGVALAEMATYRAYMRYILDVDTIAGLQTYELPGDDIVPYNRNYRRVIGYALDSAYISTNFSDSPTEWGKADNGKYFSPPYTPWNQTFYPIARSTWRYASVWFSFYEMDNSLEISGRKRYILPDSFPVHSVIQRLLDQFAPGISHDDTPEYSDFLYSSQNPISYQRFNLSVTPKSNLLIGLYQQPAQKAPATLGQFLNMLRDVFRCFWHIENRKLRIEHISWYNNGGSYTNTPIIGSDLTLLTNIRNGKKWGYQSSAYKYDRPDMPERYQFAWMDDVTEVFKGFPIEVKSKFVTPGKIEDVTVSNFTSDVDMMLLNPENMSKDGFALFATVGINSISSADNPTNTPPFSPIEIPEEPEEPEEPPIDEPEEPPVDPPVNITALRDKFDFPIGMTLKSGFGTRTASYKSAYRSHVSRIGAENHFKMHIVNPRENEYSFSGIDAIFAEAEAFDFMVHIHCITWADVNASWLKAKEGVWTTQQFRDYLISHITTVLTHCLPWKHRIAGIDSINEAFGPTGLKSSFWTRVLPDWIDVTVNTVRSIMPDIPQFANDYDFEDSNAKGPTVINYIKAAALRGVIIDGIGSQSHSSVALNMVDYERRLRVLANSGLLIHVSELDVILKPGSATSPSWATSETWLRDSSGNPVPEKDSNGNPIVDANGNPVYQFKSRTVIEQEIFRSNTQRLSAHAMFFKENFRLYQKCVPPAQRYGITTWCVGISDSGINYPTFKDFPGLFFVNYEPTPAIQMLIDMPEQNYIAP